MTHIVPPRQLSGQSPFGWLSVLGAAVLIIGMAFRATRNVAAALLVAGLIGHAFYMFYVSRRDPAALEKDVKGPDDQVLH